MKLRELLANIDGILFNPEHPSLDRPITGLSTNSHACKSGDLFLGLPGTRVDGGTFWPSALEQGAIAALITPSAAEQVPPSPDHCVIQVADMTTACAEIATAFYGYPSDQLNMIGVTGTNGKTTTTHLIEYFLTKCNKLTALLGTLYTRWQGYQKTALHTTPFAVELQQELAFARKSQCENAVMEVSSHALAQGRVLGCKFKVGVFTNLTQDHLDFHPTMEDYFAAKALLFSVDYLMGRAIINKDDVYGQRLLEGRNPDTVWSYSVSDQEADFYTTDLVYHANGVTGMLHTPQGAVKFSSPLVGQFNLSNVLAAIAAVLHLGLDLETVISFLPDFTGVPGRMERVTMGDDQDITVIVDYAHTPDSLENMLKASRPFIQGQMICVFGCGGDRDRTKRPKMGQIAAQLADIVVVTSDNPRTENPQQILDDILTGIPNSITPIVEGDRAKAIERAIAMAKTGDGVLIAGKGHEDYQILGTEKVHFDDREEARKALELRLN